ncbi:Ku protein [bacterium]|nr:Ku protein [bacterium]
MAATVWKGHLTFGLVSVPIRLYAAARTETVSFNQIHKPCGSRLKQKLHCPVCERTVERSELVRGAEVDSGRFVLIEDSEIQAVAPESAKSMEVLEFVKLEEVDPVYFDTSYFVVPESKVGEKPYYLLQRALTDMGHAAIARLVKSQREHTVILRPSAGGLMLHTLFYTDEVRSVSDYGHPELVELQEKELELGRLFVSSLAATFEAGKYHDRYRENLQALIAAKAQGQDVVSTTVSALPPAMDLMAALKASLERTKANLPPARPPLEAGGSEAATAQAQ